MRACPFLLFWLLAGACCFAQQDEKKLLDRVMAKPDMSLINPMNDKKFDGGGFLSARRQPARPSSSTSRNSQPKNIGTFALFWGSRIPGSER